MAVKKRYAHVGTGGRASFFYEAIVGSYQDSAELVAFCDSNQTRMNYANNRLAEKFPHYRPIPTYKAADFDEMIRTEKPDVVIVTTIDRTHHHYIIRAMELGCDVITEKPMTVDEDKCQQIIDTVERTGQKVRVTFNYRYSPHSTKVRELIRDGVIGDVLHVNFEWLLDTRHGADYFRRWHRDKRNSGGLLVHKSTHHFDLVNFWLNSEPKTVFAMGDLLFYGKENAEKRGETSFYQRAYGHPAAKEDPFALDLEKSPSLKGLYLDAEHEDGYQRDQSVFGDGISIEDTMNVLVRYKNNAMLNYSLHAYAPWEGHMVSFNGTKGRIQMRIGEKSYVNSGGKQTDEGATRLRQILVQPMWEDAYEVQLENKSGGHGGADPILLEDLFGTPPEDPFHRSASHLDGAMSILTGIAGNVSMRTGQAVQIENLLKFPSRA
ncbi:Gfo/Idh/MocA family oxidoreductase [Paenibacillus sp. 453mf]|uniref:Gfo/Idh/MocA family oxidoreductase n=1 Tax=Paenibacillus sp. 453mf TaxID=1761874 RepID=UPI0008F19FEB|nr:Gfo/Idh/MocA family oxidoreductase [Paenibacillus sp. 453mf]SFS61847.1 Oxidoreductase family, NAD-binding Rossmann fold [Paenibacillus sp. 453mf]